MALLLANIFLYGVPDIDWLQIYLVSGAWLLFALFLAFKLGQWYERSRKKKE
jgi:hypothetical protein